MKNKGTLYSLLGALLLAVSCDDGGVTAELESVRSQVETLEAQTEIINSNIEAISVIMNAQNKTVSSVTTDEQNRWKVALSDGTELAIAIGRFGSIDAPVIEVGADGNWYINGVSSEVKAVGTDGKNGDGYPEFRIWNGNWQVRFGGGAWSDVPGGENVVSGSVGDLFFESAAVEDGYFKVVLSSGGEYALPIAAELQCALYKDGLQLFGGSLAISENSLATILLKAIGDEVLVYPPHGCRVELTALQSEDANGNNYQITLYAPVTKATIYNSYDLCAAVRKGDFWATDHLSISLQ